MKASTGLQWFLVFMIGMLISIVSITMLFSIELILNNYLVIPLALGITGLFSALGTVYSGNRLVGDGLRTPYGAIVRYNELTAVVLVVILILVYSLELFRGPPIIISSSAGLVLGISSVYFASRLRLPPDSVPKERSQVILWLVIAFLSLPLVILIASFFGLAGA